MMDKKFFAILIFVFMIVLSVGAVSAADADDAIASNDDVDVLEDSEPTHSGSVSGGVDVVTDSPGTRSGEISYDIPTDAKTIKSADIYVNVYGVKTDDTYGSNANITITTANGDIKYNQSLCYNGEDKTKVYTINDHVTKSNLDYMIHYDITSHLSGLNGSSLKIKVDTNQIKGNATNNGYIKLIGLVLAYDDGDDDKINYWINDNQLWTNSNTTLTFDTTSLTDVCEMYLTNIGISSSDATYKLNDEFLTDADHKSGWYYQYNKWDVTSYFNSTKKTELLAIGTSGSYGINYKNSLSVLTAKEEKLNANVILATERAYNGVIVVYPATYNQITVTVNTNTNGKYTVQLLADGNVVNSTEISLTSGSTKINLIDPTIRPINETTAYVPGKYHNVTYTAKLLLNDEIVNESSLKAAILYNGYFAKDFAYPGQDYESFYNGTITGDIVIDVCKNRYLGDSNNRTDNWTVSLPNNSNFVKAWVYVAYTFGGDDTINLFNVEFNGKKPYAVSFKRDQANIPSTSGYGLIVYDVTDLIKSGENVLVLNKTHSVGAYPSTLIYLYNTTGSNVVKDVYINNGADIIGSTGNGAGRNIQLDTTLKINASDIESATAYIMGAGSKTGRASIIVNNEENTTAWDTEVDSTINIYVKDITKTVKDVNNVSIVLKNSMFTALQQIIVTSKTVKSTPAPAPTPTPVPAPAKKVASKITAKKKTFKAKTKVKKYTITLKAGKKAVKKVKVTIKIGKKTYTAKTNSKGKATFKIKKLTKKGKYNAVIKFKGNSAYKPTTKKVKITIK